MNGILLAVAIPVSMLIGFILGEGYGYLKGYKDCSKLHETYKK